MGVWRIDQGVNVGFTGNAAARSKFEKWLAGRGYGVKRTWWEGDWHFYGLTKAISIDELTQAYGPGERMQITTGQWIPATQASKPGAVQYCGGDDQLSAEMLSEELGFELVQSCRAGRLEGYDKVVVVGGQMVNPAYAAYGFATLTGLDNGMTYVQRIGNAWSVAGWSLLDTLYARDYVIEKGLPESTIRIKNSQAAPGETQLQRQWREFAANPDIVAALGLMPSATIESFSRVFSGMSYIDGGPAEPRPGDYVGVASIIAGLALAATATVMALIPGGAAAADAGYATASVQAAKTAGTGIKDLLTTAAKQAKASPLMALLILTQADVLIWGPSTLREPIKGAVSRAQSDKITLETAIKNEQWGVAKAALDDMKKEYTFVDEQLKAFPVTFFQQLGVSYEDFRVALDAGREAIDAYETSYPKLTGGELKYGETLTVENVDVLDGDTIAFPGHKDVQERIRFAGMDAHESGTDAGKAETEYLKSLIQGKNITLKIDPQNITEKYGRLLGVPYFDGVNVVHMMLAKFGKDIIGTKYKNKYVDYNQEARIAAGTEQPGKEAEAGQPAAVFKLKVDSVPSNAALFIDGETTHHRTPSDQAELADVMAMLTPGEHVFRAEKGGKFGEVKATIAAGENADIKIIIGQSVEQAQEETEAGQPEGFSINIMSTPSRAKIFIDGTYTHHLTPSDQGELADVMELLTPGKHTIRAERSGKAAEQDVEIVAGRNADIFMALEAVGLPAEKARTKEQIASDIEALQAQLAQLQSEMQGAGG